MYFLNRFMGKNESSVNVNVNEPSVNVPSVNVPSVNVSEVSVNIEESTLNERQIYLENEMSNLNQILEEKQREHYKLTQLEHSDISDERFKNRITEVEQLSKIYKELFNEYTFIKQKYQSSQYLTDKQYLDKQYLEKQYLDKQYYTDSQHQPPPTPNNSLNSQITETQNFEKNSEMINEPEKDFMKSIPDEIKNHRDFSNYLNGTYMSQMTYYSLSLELITWYLKAQRILYIESKTYCEQCLYSLMLPTIGISSICTILSLALKDISYGPLIISSLTAINTFNLALITYLKLDAKAEAHKSTAYQFDKLSTLCEFYSGKIQLFNNLESDSSKKLTTFVDTIEKKIAEIKEVNHFILPEIIRIRYSVFYSFNVFEVLRQENAKKVLNTQKLHIILNRIKNGDTSVNLIQEREELINDIIQYRMMTQQITRKFETAMTNINKIRQTIKRYGILMCLRT